MRKKKVYNSSTGITLDANFLTHVANCEQCKRFDEKKPGTLALMCLEGTVLWKRENGVTIAPEKPPKGDHWVSKQEAKRQMKYK